jgi:hypothetical protein
LSTAARADAIISGDWLPDNVPVRSDVSSTRLVSFNVVDQVAYELYLFAGVCNLSIYEFFLDQDRQFNGIEQVESKVIPEVGVDANRIQIDS